MNLNARGVRSLVVCPYAVSTGMFDGIFEKTYSWLHRTLLPILTEKQVSAATIHAIEHGLEVHVYGLLNKLTAFAVLFMEFVFAVCFRYQ